MRKVLFVTSYNPWRPTSSPKMLTLSVMEALTMLGYDVHAYCYGPPTSPDKVGLPISSFTSYPKYESKTFNSGVSIFLHSTDSRKDLLAFIGQLKPDLFVVDGFASTHCAPWLAMLDKAPVVYLAQNCTLALGHDWAETGDADLMEMIAEHEDIMVRSAARVLVFSDRDAWNFRARYKARDVRIIRPSVSAPRQIAPAYHGSFFFIGDTPWYLVEEGLAKFQAALSSRQQGIAVVKKTLSTKEMKVHNYVSDPTELMKECHCAFLPTALVSGIEPWVLYCLSAGLPVVSTDDVVQAFHPTEALKTDLKGVLDLLPGDHHALSKLGMEYVKQHYSKEASIESTRTALDGLSGA